MHIQKLYDCINQCYPNKLKKILLVIKKMTEILICQTGKGYERARYRRGNLQSSQGYGGSGDGYSPRREQSGMTRTDEIHTFLNPSNSAPGNLSPTPLRSMYKDVLHSIVCGGGSQNHLGVQLPSTFALLSDC